MSHKSQKIAAIIQSLQGGRFDAHYLGFFECFNQQLFFEAHDVLEEIWLEQRGRENDLFYKGLIQLAGAFVHIQKRRPQPALALFELARKNLSRFLPHLDGLKVNDALELVATWTASLRADPGFCDKLLKQGVWPRLTLTSSGPA